MDTPTGSGRSGRVHHHFGFSMWMAGGGVKPGITHGATDGLGMHAVNSPCQKSRGRRDGLLRSLGAK